MAKFGEIEKAIELTEEAYRVCRGVGDVSLSALWLSNLAGNALEDGNTPEARRRLDESLELARLIDDTRGIGQCSTISARSNCSKAISSKRPRASRRRLRIARRLGARWLSADAIWGFAEVAAAAGDADRAARLAGAARALGGSSGAGFDLTVLTRLTAHLNEVRAALGEQAWQKARDEGAALDLDAALRLALDR